MENVRASSLRQEPISVGFVAAWALKPALGASRHITAVRSIRHWTGGWDTSRLVCSQVRYPFLAVSVPQPTQILQFLIKVEIRKQNTLESFRTGNMNTLIMKVVLKSYGHLEYWLLDSLVKNRTN